MSKKFFSKIFFFKNFLLQKFFIFLVLCIFLFILLVIFRFDLLKNKWKFTNWGQKKLHFLKISLGLFFLNKYQEILIQANILMFCKLKKIYYISISRINFLNVERKKKIYLGELFCFCINSSLKTINLINS